MRDDFMLKDSFLRIIKKVFSFRETTLLLMILLMFIIIPFFSPVFATPQNVTTTLLGVATKGILGIGTTLILISGAIDLSVGAMIAVVCSVFGRVYLLTGSILIGALAGLAAALLGGLINGLLVTKCGLSAFITTLAINGIGRGINMVLTRGTPIRLTALPSEYRVLGSGTLFGLHYVVILFISLTLIGHFLLKRSKILRQNVYTGSSQKAAIFSGVKTKKVLVLTFLFSGFLAWIGAQLSVARFLTASPTFGIGWEVELIAAAVIGGASLNGGEGSIIGTSLGLILLGFVSSAIVLLGISVYWQNLISSMILLLAVLLDAFVENRKRKKLEKRTAS